MNDNNSGWLEIDEFKDVLISLKLIKTMSSLVSDEPENWKWVIISAHSALQGACVCNLTDTAGRGALQKDDEKALQWYHDLGSQKRIVEIHGGEWLLGDNPYPKSRLANLSELLKRLPKDLRVTVPKNLTGNEDEVTRDIYWLLEFRNMFAHFPSCGWSIELTGLPRITLNAVELIEKLIIKFSRYHTVSENEFQIVISSIKDNLKARDKP